MEALGGTSARKVLPAHWYEDAINDRRLHRRVSFETAAPLRGAPLWRRLASLNAGRILSNLYFVGESALVCVLGVVAVVLFADDTLAARALAVTEAVPLVLVPMAMALLYRTKGLYAVEQLTAFTRSIMPVLLYLCLVFCVAILGAYVMGVRGVLSGAWLSIWMLGALVGVLASRALAGWVCGRLMQVGAIQQSVAVLGNAGATRSVCDALAQANELVKVAGLYGPYRDHAEASGQSFDGDMEALRREALANAFDKIVIAADGVSSDELSAVLADLEDLPCAIQIYFAFKNKNARPGADNTIRLLDVQAKPIAGWGLLSKRLLDVTLAATALVCLTPLLLFVAVAIKLDSPGPVFFAQRRHGLNRRVFRIFKLRTMKVMEEGDRAVQAARKDPRVTRVGALLRKTSVDELPQLLNVLKGEMSLVGPRPHPLSLDDHYSDQLDIYSIRHKVKPGITGWAQINGHRGPTDQPGQMRRRVQHDLEYIDNWSFWLDLKIIAATPFLGIIHKNAV